MRSRNEKYFRYRDGAWYFDFCKNGKRYIRLGGPTKQAAKDAMAGYKLNFLISRTSRTSLAIGSRRSDVPGVLRRGIPRNVCEAESDPGRKDDYIIRKFERVFLASVGFPRSRSCSLRNTNSSDRLPCPRPR